MGLHWVSQAATKSGPVITEGWAAALAAAGWVLAAASAWWFSEDDPATPWTEGEVDWVPCTGAPGEMDPGWPYND